MKRINKKAIGIAVLGTILAGSAFAWVEKNLGEEAGAEPPSTMEEVVTVESNSLLPIAPSYGPERVRNKIRILVTAYSSTPWETDDTPFITAAGTKVREGIVAANFLPIGTRIRLPDLYGDKIFVVEDRMHPRKTYQIDIWFPSYQEAKEFGAKNAKIEILER